MLCKESGSDDWTMHIEARQIPIYAVTLTAPDGVVVHADVMRADYPEDDLNEALRADHNWSDGVIESWFGIPHLGGPPSIGNC